MEFLQTESIVGVNLSFQYLQDFTIRKVEKKLRGITLSH